MWVLIIIQVDHVKKASGEHNFLVPMLLLQTNQIEDIADNTIQSHESIVCGNREIQQVRNCNS